MTTIAARILALLMGASLALLAASASDAAEQAGRLNISVDPRLELLTAVQVQCEYFLVTKLDMAYKRDVAEYFAPYKEHEAAKLFTKMANAGFIWDGPPITMIHLSDPPELRVVVPFTDDQKNAAGGEDMLNRFVEALRDFARDTDFMSFFNAHKGTYAQMVAETQKLMDQHDCLGVLEDYFGMKQHSYNIILRPLYYPGGHGPRLERPDGTYDIYSLVGPYEVNDGVPAFGFPAPGYEEFPFQLMIWHEFSHSFVNPLVEKHKDRVDKVEALFEPIMEKVINAGYNEDWSLCVKEHIVRAVTTRLACRTLAQETGDKALHAEEERGFAYVSALCERLEDYERNRETYPTFEDFFPKVLDAFDEQLKKQQRLQGETSARREAGGYDP